MTTKQASGNASQPRTVPDEFWGRKLLEGHAHHYVDGVCRCGSKVESEQSGAA